MHHSARTAVLVHDLVKCRRRTSASGHLQQDSWPRPSVLVGMACLALNKHLPSLLFLFFSFCFSCVSLTSAAVIEKRSLRCFYFIKSSVASCSQCWSCKAEERVVAADEKDSPLLLPVQRGWKALKADKANPPPAACSRYREDDAAGRRSFHHWCQEKLSDAAAVARSAYTVTWRELLDYNKSRWNQWLLMKSVFHCCSGAAHVAGAERLLLTHGAEGEVGSCCSRVNYRHRCCSRTGMEEWQLYLRERRLLVCLGKQGAGHVFFLFL